MSIDKALGIAKSLKNHFRAFEDLETLIREAVVAQSLLKELESQKDILQINIKHMENERAGLEIGLKDGKGAMRRELESSRAALDKKLSEREKEVNAKIEEMEGKEGKVKASLDMAFMSHKDEVERMERETASAEATLRAVEKKIRDIKAKLE